MSDAFQELFNNAVSGLRISAILRTVVDLELADKFAEGPKSIEELSNEIGANRDSLYRLLRAVVRMGVLVEGPEQGRFAITKVGKWLQSNHPLRMKDVLQFHLGEPHWRAWQDLLISVRSGEPAFKHVYGTDPFGYARRSPAFAESLDNAFHATSALQARFLVGAYDFSDAKRVADIGGGTGVFLVALLRQYSEMRGVLFDQPHVIARALPLLTLAGVEQRCEVIGGDFLGGLPSGCDVYVLKYILHNWNDHEALALLRQCRRAMDGDAKLLIYDDVEPEIADATDAPQTRLWKDLEMLTLYGGRERTEADLRELLEGAGLRLSRIVSMPRHDAALVEAVPT